MMLTTIDQAVRILKAWTTTCSALVLKRHCEFCPPDKYDTTIRISSCSTEPLCFNILLFASYSENQPEKLPINKFLSYIDLLQSEINC